jgi:NAD(P)-dependent dehydrogenase (short-subunit alcohol dehydrogenase family)
MAQSLRGRKVVVIGAGSGIGRELARSVSALGAELVLSGRDARGLAETAGLLGRPAETIESDIADEGSIAALAKRVGELDHLVSTAAMHASGPVSELEAEAVERAFYAKAIGPLLLAKHLGRSFREGGSMLFFSGYVAWRPSPGLSVMATTNGAVAFLAKALSVELAPIRVNAISPGVIDSGAWDSLGPEKERYFAEIAEKNPVRRVGRSEDVVDAALYALTGTFVTGATLHVDGGGRLT